MTRHSGFFYIAVIHFHTRSVIDPRVLRFTTWQPEVKRWESRHYWQTALRDSLLSQPAIQTVGI